MHRRDVLTLAPAAGLAAAGGLVPLAVRAREGGLSIAAAQRFGVGGAEVVALSDGFLPMSPELLTVAAEDWTALLQAGYYDPEAYRGAVNAFVVRKGGETWLVDAGTGPSFGPSLGNLPGVMAAIGLEPAAVSRVLVTHLHPDHVGGMLGEDGPLFPNAEVALAESERAFWTDETVYARAPEDSKGFFDLARAVLEAYGDRVSTFSGEADVAPGVTARPLPGHTPGHAGFHLEDGGESLLFWADIVHVPPVQFARPEVTIAFDVDAEQARATRADLMASLAGTGQRVAGAHLIFPGLGYVEAEGPAYRFVPAHWDYG